MRTFQGKSLGRAHLLVTWWHWTSFIRPSDPSAVLLKQEQCAFRWPTTMFEPHQFLSIIRKCHCPLSNASNYPDHKFFKKSNLEAWSFEKSLNTTRVPFWDLGAKQNVAAFLSADNVQKYLSLLLTSSLVCHYIKLILLLIKHLKCSCIFFVFVTRLKIK